jgi:trigger factor
MADDAHRAEVTEQSNKSFQVQMVLDAIAEAEEVKVNEQELLQFLFVSAQQYQMDANEFIKLIDEQGQVPSFVAEVARRKALSIVLEAAKVSDAKGKAVNLADFLKADLEAAEDHTGHDHD